MSDPTLFQVIASLGYTTRPGGGYGSKHILKGDEIVFTGDAAEVWAWINAKRNLA